MRNRPTLAIVLSILALIISMTGTAMAAVIITSNHQVAAHTIAGANAPSGDNENLISGSVGTSDLHGSAVTGEKVASDTITNADIDESTLRMSHEVARPAGGVLSTGGLTPSGMTAYPLRHATFTQRPSELIEFIPQIQATVATPSGSTNNICQIQIDLLLDGVTHLTVVSAGTISDQPTTKAVAQRTSLVLPMAAASSSHTVSAVARLADHSGETFTDACSPSSQIDAFALHVIGTR